jgi:hypothetical protein
LDRDKSPARRERCHGELTVADQALEPKTVKIKLIAGHEKCERKLKDANEALEKKMEDFKAQVDEAIKKVGCWSGFGGVPFRCQFPGLIV